MSGTSPIRDLCRALRDIPVAIVSDVLAEAGFPDQIVSIRLRAPMPFARFAGPARCFCGKAGIDPGDGSELSYAADRTVLPGDVVVIDTDGFETAAVAGGNMIGAWRARGCAGVVVDGLIRDLDDLAPTPCIGRGTIPLNAKGRWHFTSLDAPCRLPGQTIGKIVVSPGDIVHADADGIAIIPAGLCRQIVDYARMTAGVEAKMRSAIQSGMDRGVVYKTNSRFGHIDRLNVVGTVSRQS